MIVTLSLGALQSVLFRLLACAILFIDTGSDMIMQCVIWQQDDMTLESDADNINSPMGSRKRKKKASTLSYIGRVNVHHCYQ